MTIKTPFICSSSGLLYAILSVLLQGFQMMIVLPANTFSLIVLKISYVPHCIRYCTIYGMDNSNIDKLKPPHSASAYATSDSFSHISFLCRNLRVARPKQHLTASNMRVKALLLQLRKPCTRNGPKSATIKATPMRPGKDNRVRFVCLSTQHAT